MSKNFPSFIPSSVQKKLYKALSLHEFIKRFYLTEFDSSMVDEPQETLEEWAAISAELRDTFLPLINLLAEAGCLVASVDSEEFLKKKFNWVQFSAFSAEEDGVRMGLTLATKAESYSKTVCGEHPNICRHATIEQYGYGYWKYLIRGKKPAFHAWYTDNKKLVDSKYRDFKS